VDVRGPGRENQGVSEDRTVTGRLREWRVRAGLTQRELAERSGVSVRTVRALENGAVAAPQAASLRRLAAVLDLDAALLVAPAAAPGSGSGFSDALVRVESACWLRAGLWWWSTPPASVGPGRRLSPYRI
jgi:transcriptional regulator with XRE-family HTH domain